MNGFVNEQKFLVISLSTSCLFLLTTIQRYYRLKNEYEHYNRREKMLSSITLQKRDELEKITHHINQLLVLEKTIERHNQCIFDHGDHSSMSPFISSDTFLMDEAEEEEEEDDPLLQRLKLIKPTRLQSSSREIFNPNDLTNANVIHEIHTIYEKYLSE